MFAGNAPASTVRFELDSAPLDSAGGVEVANPEPSQDVAKRHFDVNQIAPLGSHWREIYELQRELKWFWTTYAKGHWVLLEPVAIREAFQSPEIFSSVSEVAAEPDPSYTWIPTNVDPPEHVKYRQILNSWFAPKAVDALTPSAASWCETLVERIRPQGRCEFMSEFASLYPAGVFLASLGLPASDLGKMVNWVRTIFDNLRHPDLAHKLSAAMGEVRGYFSTAIAEREEAPLDPALDFISHLLRSEVDGRLLSVDEILNMCVVLVMAGVETTTGQLGYMFHHLAANPDDRHRLIAQPELIPRAVEEFLRAHPIVLPGRKVTRDVEFHGCPMRKGDMVMLPIPAVNRSNETVSQPDEVVLDRPELNRHIAFGLGAHRCLGIHLARRELATALRTWHEVIPDYSVDEAETLVERGGLLGLVRLPLVWS
jgi:cytochrome P450